jgi:hypothetical protein
MLIESPKQNLLGEAVFLVRFKLIHDSLIRGHFQSVFGNLIVFVFLGWGVVCVQRMHSAVQFVKFDLRELSIPVSG